MLSIIIPARNGPEMTADTLRTTLHALRVLHLTEHAAFILIDDNSEPSLGIAGVLRSFRADSPSPVSIYRFKKWQHYTGAFAYGLSRAKGHALFVSNDMRMTPAFLRTVLAVASLDEKIGIVRGRSAHTDSHPEHNLPPPGPLASFEDECRFAEGVALEHALEFVEDGYLSGDAVFIRRALIDRIGVMDRQFFGYFGDPDYGLRAQRAGFRLVCARGAWLVHLAEGHVKEQAKTENADLNLLRWDRMRLVQEAWSKFRAKWGTFLPEQYPGMPALDLRSLREKKLGVRMYEPPLGPESHLAEVL